MQLHLFTFSCKLTKIWMVLKSLKSCLLSKNCIPLLKDFFFYWHIRKKLLYLQNCSLKAQIHLLEVSQEGFSIWKVTFVKQNPREGSMEWFDIFLIHHLNVHAWRQLCWKFYNPEMNAEYSTFTSSVLVVLQSHPADQDRAPCHKGQFHLSLMNSAFFFFTTNTLCSSSLKSVFFTALMGECKNSRRH